MNLSMREERQGLCLRCIVQVSTSHYGAHLPGFGPEARPHACRLDNWILLSGLQFSGIDHVCEKTGIPRATVLPFI